MNEIKILMKYYVIIKYHTINYDSPSFKFHELVPKLNTRSRHYCFNAHVLFSSGHFCCCIKGYLRSWSEKMDSKSLIQQANVVVQELYDYKNRYFIGKDLEQLTVSRNEAVKGRIPVSHTSSNLINNPD